MKHDVYDDVLASVENYRTKRQEKLQTLSKAERLNFLASEQKRANRIAKNLLDMEGDDNA